MKNLLLAALLMVFACTLTAQEKASSFTDRNTDQPRDPRMDQMNFVPNEILVKFKDEAPITSSASKIKAANQGISQPW